MVIYNEGHTSRFKGRKEVVQRLYRDGKMLTGRVLGTSMISFVKGKAEVSLNLTDYSTGPRNSPSCKCLPLPTATVQRSAGYGHCG